MSKLVVCVMGQDCAENLKMCLASVKDADSIVYCDGGSIDTSEDIAMFNDCEIIENEFDQSDKEMNGKQRNFYLNYLKEKHMGEWCLCLDADEILDDNGIKEIKKYLENNIIKNDVIFDIKMRHLVSDFGHEDYTLEKHFVARRLFNIQKELFYPLGEHVVLDSIDSNKLFGRIDTATLWHLAYAPMQHIKKRYDKNLKHSNVHSKQFLDNWYKLHLFGQYPKRKIDLSDLPKALLNYYNIEKDELYFHNRELETKHFIDMLFWKTYFGLGLEDDKCDIILIGDGLGHRCFSAHLAGLNYLGTDISKWSVNNTPYEFIKGNFIQDDITNDKELPCTAKLVVAYDVLEHINYENIDKAITKIKKHAKEFILVSIPFLGNPHLNDDKTHIIKESKEWWINKFTEHDLQLLQTPDSFIFKEQILIFMVK